MRNRSCIVALALVSACSVPDVTFVKPSGDAGADTGNAGRGGHMVTARWSFNHLADNMPRSCPTGFDTATVVSQAIDPTTFTRIGDIVTDQFDCAGLQGTISLADGSHAISVRIENATGGQVYAESNVVLVDTSRGDSLFDVELLDDGGYFALSWSLRSKATGLAISCAQAQATAIHVISTGTGSPKDDEFMCDDRSGITAGLVAGGYAVSVHATNNNLSVGDASTATGTILAPNRVTDLGPIVIPI